MSEPIVHIPEGFQVYGNSVMSYLDTDGVLHMNIDAPCVMIPAESGLDVLAAMEECVPGTCAFLCGWTDAWQYNVDGTWTKFISST